MRGLGKLVRSPYQSAFRSFAIPLLLMILLHSSKFAFAEIEIAYDDGLPETTGSLDVGQCVAVRFSLPSGLSMARLAAVRIYRAGRSATNVTVHILASDGITELTKPFTVRLANESVWNEVDLISFSVAVPREFYIAIEYLAYYDPLIRQDLTSQKNRSYYGRPGSWSQLTTRGNTMIRAVVNPEPNPMSTINGSQAQGKPLASLLTYAVALALVMAATILVMRKTARFSVRPTLSRMDFCSHSIEMAMA